LNSIVFCASYQAEEKGMESSIGVKKFTRGLACKPQIGDECCKAHLELVVKLND